MNGSVLLTLNPGSSIKLGLFVVEANAPRRIGKGVIDLRHNPLALRIAEGPTTVDIPLKTVVTDDLLRDVIEETLGWLASHFTISELAAVGHRVVHGGDRFAGPEAVTDETPAAIECNATRIEGSAGKIAVLVIPTDEEQVIAEEACSALPAGGTF